MNDNLKFYWLILKESFRTDKNSCENEQVDEIIKRSRYK